MANKSALVLKLTNLCQLTKLRLHWSLILLTVGTPIALGQQDSISERPRRLDEVVVTGTNSAIGRNLLPYTVSTINANQLEATGSTQLLSAVSGMVPSLFVTERNIFGFGVATGGSGHIKMRGVGGDRASALLMMVDGQPQFAGIYSHQVADFYGTETIDRVEILRGPASVLYGSNAMAGVINIITKNPGARRVNTTLTAKYGSYNTLLTSASNALHIGRFRSFISLSYNRTDGIRKNFDFNQASAYAKVAFDVNRHWTLTTDYTLMHFTGNDPVYPQLSNPESTDVYHQNITRGEASLTATNTYGAASGATRVYYSYGNHFVRDPRRFHSLDDRLGLIAYQNLKPWAGAGMTVGFDFDRYTGRIPLSGGKDHQPGSLTTMGLKQIVEYSPYLTLSQELFSNRLTISGGLRMANSSHFRSHWVPQIGIAYRPAKGWTVKASAANGYRNPSFREMYLYKFANPELNPETMWNYELSVGKHLGRWLDIDITAYLCRATNMIQQGPVINENTGRLTNKGIEVSAASNPLDWLRLNATYSYLHSSLKTLTGSPRHQYSLTAGCAPFKGFTVDLTVKGVGRLYVADDCPIQNFATASLRLTYRVCQPLRLTLDLDNLTDTRYTITRGYTLPGFTALGGIALSL